MDKKKMIEEFAAEYLTKEIIADVSIINNNITFHFASGRKAVLKEVSNMVLLDK